MLAAAFSEAINAQDYQRFLLRQVTDWLTQALAEPEACVVLLAILLDAPRSQADGSTGALPAPPLLACLIAERECSVDRASATDAAGPLPLKVSECAGVERLSGADTAEPPELNVVGSSSISFSPQWRFNGASHPVPDSEFFLSNMAVVPALQRQGIASFLLRASEERARARDASRRVFLTARKKDEPAIQLYLCAARHAAGVCKRLPELPISTPVLYLARGYMRHLFLHLAHHFLRGMLLLCVGASACPSLSGSVRGCFQRSALP